MQAHVNILTPPTPPKRSSVNFLWVFKPFISVDYRKRSKDYIYLWIPVANPWTSTDYPCTSMLSVNFLVMIRKYFSSGYKNRQRTQVGGVKRALL